MGEKKKSSRIYRIKLNIIYLFVSVCALIKYSIFQDHRILRWVDKDVCEDGFFVWCISHGIY